MVLARVLSEPLPCRGVARPGRSSVGQPGRRVRAGEERSAQPPRQTARDPSEDPGFSCFQPRCPVPLPVRQRVHCCSGQGALARGCVCSGNLGLPGGPACPPPWRPPCRAHAECAGQRPLGRRPRPCTAPEELFLPRALQARAGAGPGEGAPLVLPQRAAPEAAQLGRGGPGKGLQLPSSAPSFPARPGPGLSRLYPKSRRTRGSPRPPAQRGLGRRSSRLHLGPPPGPHGGESPWPPAPSSAGQEAGAAPRT